ncbi:CHASE2 domain-containing protein [Breoghania sp.]|uniref:CHASE2 domain-containing protein n=1 Tax=Breoghania sp. TaxID=2065378 RepID=UPI00262B10F4|nr:CHASE2 domain-containing protein [Breoghania sp.]MDJ0931926.1 CHASE2 domain-containing protein [Breoghania sp.]
MTARRTQRRKTVFVVLAGLALLAAALSLRFANPPFVAAVRELTFDYYQRIWPRPYEPQQVCIVDIDDASLRAFGQWPWPKARALPRWWSGSSIWGRPPSPST